MRTGIWKKLVVSGLLASCVGTYGQAAELRVQIVKQCPNHPVKPKVEPSIAPLLAFLIPELISNGVDMAATALKEAAKTKTVTFVADSETFKMYKMDQNADLSLSDNVGCLLIYLPADKQSKENATPVFLPAWFTRAQEIVGGLVDPPDLYAEIQLRSSSNSLKLYLLPQLLVVTRPLQDGFWRKKKRGYVFALSFKDGDSLLPYGAATFTFDDIPLGVWTKDGRDGTSQAEWPLEVAVPKMPDNSDIADAIAAQKAATAPFRNANALIKRQYAKDNKVLAAAPADIIFEKKYVDALTNMCDELNAANSQKVTTKIADDRCPVKLFVAKRDLARAADDITLAVGYEWAKAFYTKNCVATKVSDSDSPDLCALPAPKTTATGSSQVSVSVVETSDAGAFVQELAKAFGSKKDDIKAAINDKYNPARREELADTAAAKGLDARNAYRLAMLNVQQIDAQLQEAFDKPESVRSTIRIQLTQAKIDANKAAGSAGVALPYPEFD